MRLRAEGDRRRACPGREQRRSCGRQGRASLADERAFFAAGPGASTAALEAFPGLTEREREILDLVARGLTNAEIARRLVVSDKTVRNHVSNVFAKLQVAGRAEAVARARDAGMGAAR